VSAAPGTRGARSRRPARGPDRRGGFGLVPAVFLIAVVAAVGALLVDTVAVETSTATLARRSARAYAAARSGVEWGARQALVAGSCAPSTGFDLSEAGLRGFHLEVSCSASQHVEGGATAVVHRIVSEATAGSFGSPDFVRRRIDAEVVLP
jgi:MSHA biogenesis protein MshP